MIETKVGVVIPLAEERQAFVECFSRSEQFEFSTEMRGSRVFYVWTRQHLRIILTQQEAMGNGPAQEATTALISHYSPDFLVGLGICGAIHKDLRIGDVVVVNAVFDVIDAAKATDSEGSSGSGSRATIGFDLKLMSRPHVPTPLTVNLASQLEAWDSKAFSRWQTGCVERRQEIPFPEPLVARKDIAGEVVLEPWAHDSPQLLVGASASGFVMEALSFLRVHAFNRELRIVETECAGVARGCQGERLLTPYLLMRVVTDYADANSRSGKAEDGAAQKAIGELSEAEQRRALEQKSRELADKAALNLERRRWATRNVMELFRELVLQDKFVSSVRGTVERSWDVSVLISRFKESREMLFPRERTFALAKLFTTLINDAPTPPDRRLCISAETLNLTRVNWEYAQVDQSKFSEVRILRMEKSLVDKLVEVHGIKVDMLDQFDRNLTLLRRKFSTVPFRVGEWTRLAPFHGTFHGDVFWIGHWEVDEEEHRLTSSTPFILYNGASAIAEAARYRRIFNAPFEDSTFGTPYPPYKDSREHSNG